MAPALLGRFEPLHLRPPPEARFDRLQRDHSIGQDLPLAVDVGEEAIDRFEPLLEALIEALPVLLINQPRQRIKRQDPFTGLAVVVVEAKGGAQPFQQLLGAAVVVVDLLQPDGAQPGHQFPE